MRRLKDYKINVKEIMYEFESDLCGPLYDFVLMCFFVSFRCLSRYGFLYLVVDYRLLNKVALP
jgi:hypothetical protein